MPVISSMSCRSRVVEWFRRSAADVEFRYVVEVAIAGDHDLLPGRQALQDLDLADRGGAELDRRQHGLVTVDDIDGPGAGDDVRAALELHGLRALLDHDADGAALALPEARGLLARELHAAGHLAGAHFRRDGGDEALVLAAVERDLRVHPRLDVAGVDVRDLELDLEGRQVDDGEQRRVLRDARLLGGGEVRDHAVHRRAHGQLVDAALEVRDDVALALALEPTRTQVEVEALPLEARRFHRMVVGELGRLAIVFGGFQVALGYGALLEGPLGTLVLALGGTDLHVGEVGRFLGREPLPADLDRLALQCRVEAFERRALALEFALERRARERSQHLAGLDGVAGANDVADVAGRDGEERRAHGGDDRALRGNVAHERPFGHGRDAQALARHGVFGGAPAADLEAEDEDERDAARGNADRLLARAVGLRGDGQVLGVGAADRSVAGGRRIPPAGRQRT